MYFTIYTVRLKTFPIRWIEEASKVKFINPEYSVIYKNLYYKLVQNIEEGGENRLLNSSL